MGLMGLIGLIGLIGAVSPVIGAVRPVEAPLVVTGSKVAVATREVDGRHVLVGGDVGIIALRLGEDGCGVEVGHVHPLRAEVGRGTVDAVAGVARGETLTSVADDGRSLLVLSRVGVAVGECLSEEEVVVGPDGHVVVAHRGVAIGVGGAFCAHADVVPLGDVATGKDEVAVVETVLHVAQVGRVHGAAGAVEGIGVRIEGCALRGGQGAVGGGE